MIEAKQKTFCGMEKDKYMGVEIGLMNEGVTPKVNDVELCSLLKASLPSLK